MNQDNTNNIINLVDYLNNTKSFKYDLLQAQRVEITPSFFKKIVSFGIDFLSILILKTLVTIGYASFVQSYLFMLNNEQMTFLVNANFSLHLSLTVLIYYSYFLFCNYVMAGKTFGKYVLKITTINDDFIFNDEQNDTGMNLSQAARRAFGYLLCYISFGTFFIFSFFSEDKRGLQDFFSGTRTVNDEWIEAIQDYKLYGKEVITIDILELNKVA